jgi:hypothetical protein
MRGAPRARRAARHARSPERGGRRLGAGQAGAPGGGAREAVRIGQAQRGGRHAAAPAGAVQPTARIGDVSRVRRQPGYMANQDVCRVQRQPGNPYPNIPLP